MFIKKKIEFLIFLSIILMIIFFISIFQGYTDFTIIAIAKLLMKKIGFELNDNLPVNIETIIISAVIVIGFF